MGGCASIYLANTIRSRSSNSLNSVPVLVPVPMTFSPLVWINRLKGAKVSLKKFREGLVIQSREWLLIAFDYIMCKTEVHVHILLLFLLHPLSVAHWNWRADHYRLSKIWKSWISFSHPLLKCEILFSPPTTLSFLGHHIGRGEIFVSGMDGRRERVEPGISGDIHFLLLRIPQYVRSIWMLLIKKYNRKDHRFPSSSSYLTTFPTRRALEFVINRHLIRIKERDTLHGNAILLRMSKGIWICLCTGWELDWNRCVCGGMIDYTPDLLCNVLYLWIRRLIERIIFACVPNWMNPPPLLH